MNERRQDEKYEVIHHRSQRPVPMKYIGKLITRDRLQICQMFVLLLGEVWDLWDMFEWPKSWPP